MARPISRVRLVQLQGLLSWYRGELERLDFDCQVDIQIRDILRLIAHDLEENEL